MNKLKQIIIQLAKGEILEAKYKGHKLIGNYTDRRECHIEPDWLLIYKLIPQDDLIIFERTGTHSDLFN